MKLKAAKSFRVGGVNYSRGADVTDLSEARARDLHKRGLVTGTIGKGKDEPAKGEGDSAAKPDANKAEKAAPKNKSE